MKSRLSILTIAIAALLVSESTVRAQGYGYGGPQGAPGPNGYVQPAAMMQPPPDVLPPAAFPDGGVGSEFIGGDTFDLSPVMDPIYPWRYWGTTEAMLVWRHGQALPVLFTTSPSPTTPLLRNNVPNALVLGGPDTTVLFGGSPVGTNVELGLNVSLGMWLDELKEVGIGMRAFALSKSVGAFDFASDPNAGGPDLGRPFFNTTIGRQDALPVAFTGPADDPLDPTILTLSRGSVSARFSNQVYGGDILGRVNWDRAPGFSLDLIGGYQYVRIDDKLSTRSIWVDLQPGNGIPDGTVFTDNDAIRAKNDFHGISMGFMSDIQGGRFNLAMMGKCALGDMHQNINVNSSSLVDGVPVASSGFIGTRGIVKRDQFCVVPEGSLTGGYQLTDNINLSVGWNFMYFSRVATAGGQVQQNRTGAFGAPAPLAIRNSDFWFQGVTLGVNARF